MHECVLARPSSPGCLDLTPDDTLLGHRHDQLVARAVRSRTEGPGALGLKPGSIPPPRPATPPPAPLRFENASVLAVVPSRPQPSRATPITPLWIPSPPPGTAPPSRHTCSKRPLNTIARSVPQPAPLLAPGSSLFLRSSPPPRTTPPGPFS